MLAGGESSGEAARVAFQGEPVGGVFARQALLKRSGGENDSMAELGSHGWPGRRQAKAE